MSFLFSLWDKYIENPDRNSKIMAAIFLFQLIPFVFPLGLPLPYSPYTRDWFAYVDGGETSYGVTLPGIQAGDLVVWGDASEHTAYYSTQRDFWGTQVMAIMGERGAKMIFAVFATPSISIFTDLIDRYMGRYNVVYGEHYLVTEYLPGMEAAVKFFADNLGEVKDIRGNTISSYSAFADVSDFNDVDYAYDTAPRATDHDMFIRQWATQYPNINFMLGTEYATGAAYYGTLVKAVWQYQYEIEQIAGVNYGAHFFGEEIIKVEARSVWTLVYIPLLIWGLFVNWRRALKEGISLIPRVGERGQ